MWGRIRCQQAVFDLVVRSLVPRGSYLAWCAMCAVCRRISSVDLRDHLCLPQNSLSQECARPSNPTWACDMSLSPANDQLLRVNGLQFWFGVPCEAKGQFLDCIQNVGCDFLRV